MKFGLWYAAVGPFAYPDAAVQVALAAEEAGLESLWTGEHVAVPAGYRSEYPYSENGRMAGDGAVPMAEPFVWLSYVAARTSRIRLTTGVLVLPQREPVLVAKQAATLAVLSGERFSLGVGAGWLREEFEALGADFSTRTRRLEEYVSAMRQLWANDRATFHGQFVSFDELQLTPRPASGRVPVILGGHTEPAARRAGRVGEGFFPAKGSVDDLARLFDMARDAARSSGRDPDALELTIHDPSVVEAHAAPAAIERWRRIGVSRIIINPTTFDASQLAEQLARFGEEVVRHASN
jgi:probable F420-dependent oxidoreductase